jgi:hypothetical protein
VSGCCECGDEPSGSCPTELVSLTHAEQPLTAELNGCKLLAEKKFIIIGTFCNNLQASYDTSDVNNMNISRI